MSEGIIPVLEKSILLMRYLSSKDDGATPAEIAEETGMSIATCYRAIQTFLKHNWLNKTATGKYALGYGIAEIAGTLINTYNTFEILQPIIDDLSQQTGMSIKLSIRNGLNEFITFLTAHPNSPIALFSKKGARFPIIEGSVGAVFLRNTPESEIKRFIKAAPLKTKEKSNSALLFNRIDECNKKGYCFLNQEGNIHSETISAPLYGIRTEAVLSILGFPEDFEGREKHISRMLLATIKKGEEMLKTTFSFAR